MRVEDEVPHPLECVSLDGILVLVEQCASMFIESLGPLEDLLLLDSEQGSWSEDYSVSLSHHLLVTRLWFNIPLLLLFVISLLFVHLIIIFGSICVKQVFECPVKSCLYAWEVLLILRDIVVSNGMSITQHGKWQHFPYICIDQGHVIGTVIDGLRLCEVHNIC